MSTFKWLIEAKEKKKQTNPNQPTKNKPKHTQKNPNPKTKQNPTTQAAVATQHRSGALPQQCYCSMSKHSKNNEEVKLTERKQNAECNKSIHPGFKHTN